MLKQKVGSFAALKQFDEETLNSVSKILQRERSNDRSTPRELTPRVSTVVHGSKVPSQQDILDAVTRSGKSGRNVQIDPTPPFSLRYPAQASMTGTEYRNLNPRH
jgi:hypothetical protein